MKDSKRGIANKRMLPVEKRTGSADVLARLGHIDEHVRHAVLATDACGQPYTSLVAFAIAPGLKGLVFATPKNSEKYFNIMKNNKVAVLADTRCGARCDFMKTEAVTIIGDAKQVRRGKRWDDLAGILLRKHPELDGFVNSPTTALVYVRMSACYHVGGFQTVSVWRRK
jgi:hypothetical protein